MKSILLCGKGMADKDRVMEGKQGGIERRDDDYTDRVDVRASIFSLLGIFEHDVELRRWALVRAGEYYE